MKNMPRLENENKYPQLDRATSPLHCTHCLHHARRGEASENKIE
jgi:hypothetical protein